MRETGRPEATEMRSIIVALGLFKLAFVSFVILQVMREMDISLSARVLTIIALAVWSIKVDVTH